MTDEITLENILAKDATDLSEAEVAHLNEHASQLTDEQKEKFESVLTDEETNPAKDGDSDEKKGDNGTE